MNVLHVSRFDIRGGAGLAAYRLHTGLSALNVSSRMLVTQQGSHDTTITTPQWPEDAITSVRRTIRRTIIARAFAAYRHSRPAGYEAFSDDRSQHIYGVADQFLNADIINLHWAAELIDYRTFFRTVARNHPVVWTIHDMNAFTGGCHYDEGCGFFQVGCGSCPQLGSSQPNDLSRAVWRRKQAVFDKLSPDALHIVAPSQWLTQEAQNSPLLRRFSVSCIPNSVDTDSFAPRHRDSLRDILGIAPQGQALLFVANDLTNRRKGFGLLVEALKSLGDQTNLCLISVGRNKPEIPTDLLHIHLGQITNPQLLSAVYSLADLFVIPSLQDNLPNTVLESLACGTPVVGFDCGGIPDMVRPGITGLLAPAKDIEALRTTIIDLLADETRRQDMRVKCRQIAIEEYSLNRQATRYLELYTSLLGE